MTDRELLRDAVAELYGVAPHEFIARRAALAAAARGAGDLPVAKQIAALRKPTQSAWIVNQLARSVPSAGPQLAELGADLRQAQRTLDGAAIRELSVRRRELIDDLTRQAFAAVGQPAPPAALRDEVTTTLAAVVADPEVAGQFEAGAMARAARSDGFGATGPLLTVVGPSDPARPRPGLLRPGLLGLGRRRARLGRPGPGQPGPGPRVRGRPARAPASAAPAEVRPLKPAPARPSAARATSAEATSTEAAPAEAASTQGRVDSSRVGQGDLGQGRARQVGRPPGDPDQARPPGERCRRREGAPGPPPPRPG